jgi:thiosulfate dehydrogenase [quinone] large subunit
MLGLLEKISAIAGMVLLGFYYLSHPPLAGLGYIIPSEGNYLIINKTLIEFFAMWVLYHFPTGREIGLDRFVFWKYVQK